jgi:probable rRNA maturation factor
MIVIRRQLRSVDQRTLTKFAASAQRAIGLKGAISLLVTNDAEMKALNRYFRGKNKATDVLSFPAPQYPGQKVVGDLAISAKMARESAKRLGHSVSDEIKILLLHGMLHLAGYDHESDSGEMAKAEQLLQQKLHLPVSLIERNSESVRKHKSAKSNKVTAKLKLQPGNPTQRRGKKLSR